MSTRRDLEQVGRDSGWDVVSSVSSAQFTRGSEHIFVGFDSRDNVLKVHVGGIGGYDITGSAKRSQAAALLRRQLVLLTPAI